MGENQPAHIKFFRREASGLVSHLGLKDSIIPFAEQLFRQGYDSNFKVTSWSRFTAVCLLGALKLQNIPFTDHEFAEGSRHNIKELTEVLHNLADELELPLKPQDPEAYIKRYCEELGLENEAQSLALEIDDQARDEVYGTGMAPSSYAAAVIYVTSLSLDLDVLQPDIAKVSGKTELTIRNRYQDILEAIDIKVSGRRGRNRD